MSRRNKKNQNNEGGAPGWMTTYSDLMSLLLTFFILLYSMSTLNVQKFKDITRSLQAILSGVGHLSIIEEGSSSSDNMPVDEYLDGIIDRDIQEIIVPDKIRIMYDKVKEYVSNMGLDANITVTANKRGVFVDINEAILFEPGKAELKQSGIQVLKQLEGLINDFDNELVVEGHTDNIPMRSLQYPSNWELSTARAVKVLRYLTEVEGVDPRRLSAVGYGEYHPIAPNNTPENRSANRRVNILIIINEEGDNIDNS